MVVQKIPLRRAEQYGEQLVTLVDSACERIEVAGDIRLRRDPVTDLVVVAIPQLVSQVDMFGEDRGARDMLREVLDRLLKSGRVERVKDAPVWTDSYRRFDFRTARGAMVPVHFYSTTTTAWGVDLALRTGPPSLAAALVAKRGSVSVRGRAGMLPAGYLVYGGLQLVETGEAVPTPEEADFLRLFYGDEIPPPERRH